MQMILRHDALKVAEASTLSELKTRAAAALQATRHEDLEMIRVETSAAVYQEHFDQVRDSMSSGATWQEALLSFAKCSPLSGDYEQNCATIEHIRNAAPLLALFPDKVLGPDGLPIYEAISPEDRFDGDLTKWEAQVISGNLRPLTAALHSIPERFGIPDQSALVGFLSQWPSTNQYVIQGATVALQRFWCGDYEGATYTATPWIENAIRQVILDANQGIYMLQNIRRPGQYPGLGAMIDLLADRFTLSQSRYRFLRATLTHPLGFNLRNQLSHGMTLYNTSPAVALALHTLLTVHRARVWSQLGRWKWHDPDTHVQLLVDNNTRLWIFSPQSLTSSDAAAMLGSADQAQGSNRTFYDHYREVGGRNGHFDLPISGDHGWSSWGPQVAAMSADLVASIR